MKFSLCFFSLITICILPKTYSEKTKAIPGCVGCGFFGATPKTCGEIVPAANLPKECEALYYYWIHTDETSEIIDIVGDVSNAAYMKDLDSTNKPIFLYFGRVAIDDWLPVINNICKDGGIRLQKEVTNLKNYVDQYNNIAGLIVNNLTPELSSELNPDFTQNVKIYIDEVKKCLPDYSIGMEIISRLMLDLHCGNKNWLDFKVLDECLDFYVLDLYYFNDCTPDYKVGGATPVNSGKGRTLEQVIAVAKELGMTQSKIIYAYRCGPSPADPSGPLCLLTNTEWCRRKSNDDYCMDTTLTFVEKGKFAKANGHGFLMTNMDTDDDPNGSCQCGTPYPAFHDVLAGFKCLPTPKPCPLLDKC